MAERVRFLTDVEILDLGRWTYDTRGTAFEQRSISRSSCWLMFKGSPAL